MTATALYLDLQRLVITGRSRRPDLADDLARAAAMVRDAPPRHASTDSHLWLVPCDHRENVAYLVNRTTKTCKAPECRRHPGRLCKHRLAVEMFCRLNDEPNPPEDTSP